MKLPDSAFNIDVKSAHTFYILIIILQRGSEIKKTPCTKRVHKISNKQTHSGITNIPPLPYTKVYIMLTYSSTLSTLIPQLSVASSSVL